MHFKTHKHESLSEKNYILLEAIYYFLWSKENSIPSMYYRSFLFVLLQCYQIWLTRTLKANACKISTFKIPRIQYLTYFNQSQHWLRPVKQFCNWSSVFRIWKSFVDFAFKTITLLHYAIVTYFYIVIIYLRQKKYTGVFYNSVQITVLTTMIMSCCEKSL